MQYLGQRRTAECPSAHAAVLYGLLAVLTLGLGMARLVTGPWYLHYYPAGGSLLEGWPVSWENIYYIVHFPTFLGDGPPPQGIAPVHYRTFGSLYLVTLLYGWTGSAFWSMAIVDLLFWFLAGVAMHRLALRLGASAPAAALSALLVAASPVFVFSIWRHDMHPSEIATLPLGLWAAAVLIAEERRLWRLTAGLGLLLLLLSLGYQYQWLMVPLLLALAPPRLGWRRGVAAVAGAVAVLGAGTFLIKGILGAVGLGPEAGFLVAVSQPDALLAERLARVRSFGDLLAMLPGPFYLRMVVETYHPLVFAVGLAGWLLLPWQTRVLGVLATAGSLASITLYAAPWTAMSAFPLVYTGVGAACAELGARSAQLAGRLTGRGAAADAPRPARNVLMYAVGGGVALVLAALTNLDLVGSTRFLLRWWEYYARVPLF